MPKSICTRLSVGLILAAIVPFGATQASSIITKDFADVNDCAGYFGPNFEACTIFVNDSGEQIELSPVIAKYEWDDDGSGSNHIVTDIETNPLFSSIDGTEYTFSNYDPTDQAKSGDWNYNPGAGDPGTRYWAVKDGGGFVLAWQVSDAAAAGACAGPDTYVLACLSEAEIVTSGSWATLGQGLSHITFYDTAIPVPAALWLFGSAIGLLGWMRRRTI